MAKKQNGKAQSGRSAPVENVGRMAIKDLVPYARNPRTHSPEQVDRLAESMRHFQQASFVLVDEKGEIIAGHGRVLAAEKLGWETIAVMKAVGWSDEDKRAYRITDNQTALLSGWDNELLKIELGELKLEGFDLELLGFPNVELVQFMTGIGPEGASSGAPIDAGKMLAEQFGAVPFTVFNAREGWWQDRKRAWIALGIQSELGRGENLLQFSDSVRLDGKAYNERFKNGGKRA